MTKKLLAVELAALALLLAAASPDQGGRVVLVCASIGCLVIALGRGLGRRIVTATAWATRGRSQSATAGTSSDSIITDADGMVAVFELGAPATLVSVGGTRLPDLDAWPSLSHLDGPPIHQQLLISASRTTTRTLLAVRAGRSDHRGIFDDTATRAALRAAVRRATRRLDHGGIIHRRLDGDDLHAATGLGEIAHESWTHLRINETMHVTLTAAVPVDGLTQALLARLTAATNALTTLTWSADAITIRLTATSAAALNRSINDIASTLAVRRMDGEQLRGWRATLPLALQAGSGGASVRGGRALTVPAAGLRVGFARDGAELRLRLPTGATPTRILVIGGPATAQSLARRAEAAGVRVLGNVTAAFTTDEDLDVVRPEGVPVRIDVLDRPTASDARTLRGADIVVCQPLAPREAAIVTDALGLSPATRAWLSSVGHGMVAVIADGVVRWASTTMDTHAAASGMAAPRLP